MPRRKRDLPNGLTAEEIANLVLECIECLPPTLDKETERKVVGCLCSYFARRYHYPPRLILYLVRYPLAPQPENLEDWDPPELLVDIPETHSPGREV